MTTRRTWTVAAAAVLILCAAAPRPIVAQSDAAVRRCNPLTAPIRPAILRAEACAEEFISHNGYTLALPSLADSSRWAPESAERGPRKEWLASRHGTLRDNPFAACPRSDGGFVIGFLRRNGHGARAVTMDAHFANMWVEHRDLPMAYVTRPGSRCTQVRSLTTAGAGRDGPH